MPQKSWAVGEEVLAADFNTYMQNQVVPQFTNAAQRDSQWTAPPNGAMCVTTDTYTLYQRAGGAWRPAPALPAYRSLITLNGAPTAATETWYGTITVPSLPYGHRVRVLATNLFTMSGAGNIDFRIRYNTTGAAIALTDTLLRSHVVAANSGPCSITLQAALDRASGTTSIGVLALTSGPNATTSNTSTTAQLEVWAEAT